MFAIALFAANKADDQQKPLTLRREPIFEITPEIKIFIAGGLAAFATFSPIIFVGVYSLSIGQLV